MRSVEAETKEALVSPIDSLAIIGRGLVGSMFVERFTALEGLKVLAAGRGEIASVMEQQPEVVLAATPNPVGEVAAELAARAIAPFSLVLPQNGVGVIEQAQRALGRSDISLIRASLYTMVSQSDNGVAYDPAKLRLTLSPGRHQDRRELSRVRLALMSAGFAVVTCENPRDMEWTKLLVNSIGSTSTVTGLTPRETFVDENLFSLELTGLRQRSAVIRAGGIKLVNIPWAKTPLLRLGASVLPSYVPGALKQLIAETVAEGRDNLPSAAARKITEGREPSEALEYHLPFIQLAKETGLTATVDEAIVEVIQQHLRGEIHLQEMTSRQKTDLLTLVLRNGGSLPRK
ncbi:MAG: hypothetical protein A2900_02330 [Candidatus Chisholmbacteria bacterium RIFCSPLOWO2_01_FULL_50_28]|uniref:Uncharacterized protein n=1 Tax=Candidatus Chisholmbacteria bacterium RIFCSPHIGHO2_01_FULL_52_32 TaxID=1797591 RepID=A0A1G1VTM6_9BACT|nr:MAG: hypothetical protein A2786_04415 [Candidatus Chisholmbacteria bacterium RIFCSPHIGHO2_01_FULL_52_32]OGY19920.1 MAG: hypothetical protein A2900_02330 [Candidatus Chisholmbacteria bacterium RIFCSPLOWO2_01_FULL_50_28]